MDNVIWIILATAVFIALAGILLFVGTDALGEVDEDYNFFSGLDPNPDDAQDELTGSATTVDRSLNLLHRQIDTVILEKNNFIQPNMVRIYG